MSKGQHGDIMARYPAPLMSSDSRNATRHNFTRQVTPIIYIYPPGEVSKDKPLAYMSWEETRRGPGVVTWQMEGREGESLPLGKHSIILIVNANNVHASASLHGPVTPVVHVKLHEAEERQSRPQSIFIVTFSVTRPGIYNLTAFISDFGDDNEKTGHGCSCRSKGDYSLEPFMLQFGIDKFNTRVQSMTAEGPLVDESRSCNVQPVYDDSVYRTSNGQLPLCSTEKEIVDGGGHGFQLTALLWLL